MAASIENLYLKYRNRVQRYLEDDAYYNYFMELIQSGENVITQNNRVLHKQVDEVWLSAVEKVIPALFEITGRPRKFIRSVEHLVPVELAKKITADAVKHLSQHTQYIVGMNGDDIVPGKIMTVENEDSLELYENRFVVALIKRLVNFIDRRTDIIFWSTGDERNSVLKMNSVVEDDFEEVEYKLEMVIKNKQNYLENDNSQMEIFKRIDRVRRVVTDFRSSVFMQVLRDAPAVRPPIQRTNMLMKDRNYKACFDMWNFLDHYDQIGYEIDVKETALDFDEDYLFQLYSNLALNYTVFKTILDADPRRIDDAPAKKRKKIKPKFVKQIVDEFVDDYDIPDVEIRKVIVEEVTKAQAEIERRKAELERKRALQKEKREKQRAIQKEKLEKKKALEKEKLEKQKALEKEKAKLAKEKEAEQAKLAKQKEAEKAKLAKEKEAEKAKLAKQKEAEKQKLAKQKEAEKQKLAKQKEAEKQKLAKQKEAEKQKLAKKKEAEKAKRAKQKGKNTKPKNPKDEK